MAGVKHWCERLPAFFASALYHAHADALERIWGHIDLRRDIIRGDPAAFSCLAATMVQDAFDTSAALGDAYRAACALSIFKIRRYHRSRHR